MVTSDSKWFNEMDGEQAFPSLGRDDDRGIRVDGAARTWSVALG
jgi:hypothetical protein